MGFVQANAISVKWTGLATPGIVGIESFFRLMFLKVWMTAFFIIASHA
jgi:hypothetical protein